MLNLFALAPLLAQDAGPKIPPAGFDPAEMLQLLGGPAVLLVMAGIGFVMYVYVASCLMIAANKTNTPHGWMAWFPILNMFLATSIARMSALWAILAFMPCLQIIAIPMIIGGIATARGKPGWIGILVFVPIINLFVPLMLAVGPGGYTAPPMGTPNMAGGGARACPACGTFAKPGATFCGNCGQWIPAGAGAAYTGPPVAGAAPAPAKSSSAMGCLMFLVLGSGVMMLGCCGFGAYLYYAPGSYTAPVARQKPQVPAGVAGTRIAFPRDSQAGGSRPTTTVTQTIRRNPDGTVKAPMEIPQTQLPQGITSQSLANASNSITSATYRQVDATTGKSTGPPVIIHSLEPVSPQSIDTLVQQVTQANPSAPPQQDGIRTPNGVDYARWTFAAGQTQTIIMQNMAQPLVIIIYAPAPEAFPVATRLSNNVGNSQGLDEPEMITCIETLPAVPPPEFVLDSMFTWSKAETDPAAFTQGTENNAELARLMQQVYTALPEFLTAGLYTKGGREYGAVVCTYPSLQQARALWYAISWTIGTQATSKVTANGSSALVFADQKGVIIAFWKGPYLVLLYTEDPQDVEQLRQLADTLQL